MTLQQHFEKWAKEDYFPEIDLTQRNGKYVNSTTGLMWVGWKGCYEHFKEQKRKESEGKEYT